MTDLAKSRALMERLRKASVYEEYKAILSNLGDEAADTIEAQAARIEETDHALDLADHALDLAESIVASMPSNGGNWNLLQRFGATLSKYRALFKDNDHG